MSGSMRARINLSTREFEAEGSESVVKEWFDGLPDMLLKLQDLGGHLSEQDGPAPSVSLAFNGDDEPQPPAAFGEFLHQFPTQVTDIDRMLIAGAFIQRSSSDQGFSTREASESLKEQAIKLANPSSCVKRNLDARRVFSIGQGRFRVSQAGADYLRRLQGGSSGNEATA